MKWNKMVDMFHLKDTKEFKEIQQKWADLKKKKYLESMKSGLTTSYVLKVRDPKNVCE